MELKQLIYLLKHWFWLLVLGFCLGAVSGILISRIQKPVYQAEARVMVMRVPDQSTLGLAYLGDQQLAQTFTELITTQPVYDSVSNQLEFAIDPKLIRIQKNSNSQIINVLIEDKNPQRSAKIANTLVEEAIKRYVDLQIGQYTTIEYDIQNQLNFLRSQMTTTQSKITETSDAILNSQIEQIQSKMSPLQEEVSQLQQDIVKLNPANTPEKLSLLAEKQTRLEQISPLLTAYQDAYSNLVVLNKPVDNGSVDETNLILLEKTLEVYQQNYVELMSKLELSLQSHSQGISNVTIIQDASVPTKPLRPNILINTLLTSAIGFILAVVAIFIMYDLGIVKFPTWKVSNSKVEERLDQPASE